MDPLEKALFNLILAARATVKPTRSELREISRRVAQEIRGSIQQEMMGEYGR